MLQDEFFRPHDTAVIEVPQRAPSEAITREEPSVDLLNRVKRVSSEWVKPGHSRGQNTHNVSATITVKEGEWPEVAEWMWNNKEHYNGLSVLPYSEHTYRQAPFEDCSETEYHGKLKMLSSLDVSSIIEIEDNTDLKGELACAGGACEII